MKFVQWMKTGKRIFCCLLVLVLTVGQSLLLVYAKDMDNSEGKRAVGDVIEVDGIRYRLSGVTITPSVRNFPWNG